MSSSMNISAPQVEIRPIEPDDRDALARGFDRLSERSRYRRFLSPRGPLSEAELSYLTEVDHRDHEALVAVDPETNEGVGVARFIRSAEDPALAEIDAILGLLRDLGEVHTGRTELGTVELAVDLPDEGISRLRRLLRAVARGDITVLLRRTSRLAGSRPDDP